MQFQAWFLSKNGYTLSCPRLANHGQPLHVLKATHWEEFYSGVRETYLSLRKDHEHVLVGGLPMGALLALELAAEFNSDLKGVICLSPARARPEDSREIGSTLPLGRGAIGAIEVGFSR